MVFIGNPFSGVTSAPPLLPEAIDHIGQWLPPGAGGNLLRSTAYFNGNGAAGHVTVLVLWILFGVVAIVIGHHTSIRFVAAVEAPAEGARSTWAEGSHRSTAVAPTSVLRLTDGEHLDSGPEPGPAPGTRGLHAAGSGRHQEPLRGGT
jgi:hypothetical protein